MSEAGEHGWKRNSHLRLPVGFLPPEWQGKRARVTFEVEPRRRAAQKHGPKERAAAVARVVEFGKTAPVARELRVSENTLVKWCIAAGCWPPTPPTKSPTLLGRKVQDLRRKRQLTQAELANLAGLSAATVTNIERGAERGTHLATIHGLARALGVPPDELSNLRRRTKRKSP
jgi:DNA-binding XRE family transcriptional regulator